jgi:hypothetical protein
MIPIKSLMVGCLILMVLQTLSLVAKYWMTLRDEAVA